MTQAAELTNVSQPSERPRDAEGSLSLSEFGLGRSTVVAAVGGERGFRRRLMELGLVPGTTVRVVKVAPLGDPLELVVRGASLSIRAAEAAAVQVFAVEDGSRESSFDARA